MILLRSKGHCPLGCSVVMPLQSRSLWGDTTCDESGCEALEPPHFQLLPLVLQLCLLKQPLLQYCR